MSDHPLDNVEILALHNRLQLLRQEHRDLDQAIAALQLAPTSDQFQLRRLKKRKLLLKDMIRRFESELIPDLDA
ncbi:MAG: DUF465 domain-containing protein [Gammaproteobacteria bacterium]|nr:DUF465 domain-containing protein [Gammaproteobacteria bacterium]